MYSGNIEHAKWFPYLFGGAGLTFVLAGINKNAKTGKSE
jgi:hypothetical protein